MSSYAIANSIAIPTRQPEYDTELIPYHMTNTETCCVVHACACLPVRLVSQQASQPSKEASQAWLAYNFVERFRIQGGELFKARQHGFEEIAP